MPAVVHPKARAILEAYYATRGGLTEARLRMARVPQGAELIENKMSGAPGIRLGNIFILYSGHVKLLNGVENRIDLQGAYYRDLRSAAEATAVRSAFDRCGKIATADHRPIPHLRWWIEGDPGSVAPVGSPEARGARVLLLPRRTRAMKRFYTTKFPRVTAPAGFQRVYRNASWRVLAAPGCQ